MEADLPSLPVDTSTWNVACRLANFGRTRGLQFPAMDLLIFACAQRHATELVTRDKHFAQLAALWAQIQSSEVE
jgi:predicted nucleic acid-binding protein